MDSPFPAEELKALWGRFEGSPFAFWDRIYAKGKDAATASQALDPLLGQGSDASFVHRILAAANKSAASGPVGHPKETAGIRGIHASGRSRSSNQGPY